MIPLHTMRHWFTSVIFSSTIERNFGREEDSVNPGRRV
jgi:hypothetical protein